MNWLNVDWQHYIDEDDEDEEATMPNYGNEHSFPGFGDQELPDEDDEPVEHGNNSKYIII